MTRKHFPIVVAWTLLSLAALAQGAAVPQVPPARPNQRISVRPVTHDDLAKPPAADWLTYHGGDNGGPPRTPSQGGKTTVSPPRRAWLRATGPPATPPRRGRG